MKIMYLVVIIDENKEQEGVVSETIKVSKPEAEVYKAATSIELVEIVKSGSPNLVIAGHKSPHVDGLAALQAVREFSNVPFYIRSNGLDPELPKRARELGATEYIRRGTSCDLYDIQTAVHAHLKPKEELPAN